MKELALFVACLAWLFLTGSTGRGDEFVVGCAERELVSIGVQLLDGNGVLGVATGVRVNALDEFGALERGEVDVLLRWFPLTPHPRPHPGGPEAP